MFSPLALTQTLPFLPLAQGDIDYQVARRGDPDLFDTLFADLPALTLTAAQVKPCRNGAAIPMAGRGRCRVYGPDGAFLMVGRLEQGRLMTEKSFFEV